MLGPIDLCCDILKMERPGGDPPQRYEGDVRHMCGKPESDVGPLFRGDLRGVCARCALPPLRRYGKD